ncbi:MAG: ectoine hydroxylase [Sandaracinus sp.]|nr:ectoine hydroxylase [Sandaracinus sp.]
MNAEPQPERSGRTSPYPSRLPEGSPERFVPRGVPTVWTEGAAGPLEAREFAHFAKEGFHASPSFFAPADVAAMQGELETQLAWARAHADDPRVILEPGSDAVRSIFAVHETSERFAGLARDPRLLGLARQILGDEVYLHQTRLNLKPGFDGKEFWWHSDFETWHHEDGMPTMRCFSCVVALSEITEHNGPVMFVPGSHQTFVSCVGETPDANHERSLRAQTIGVPSREAIATLVERHGLVAPKGPAGTVILFDCNLMHGSGGNVTPLPRHHLFFVYNAMSNRVGPPYSARHPRPEHIATRTKITPLIDAS